LLRDPSDYHLLPLAYPGRGAGSPVAVVEHAQVNAWLDALVVHRSRIRSMIPDYLQIREPEPGTWFLDVSEPPFLLRRCDGFGGAALIGHLADRVPGVVLLALEDTESPPALLRVRAGNATQAALVRDWRAQLATHSIALDIVQDDRSRSLWLSAEPPPEPALNLLQGLYRVRSDAPVSLKRVLPAASLALSVLIILALQWFLDLTQLRSAHRALSDSIEGTYRQAFPGTRNIIDPRYQMGQKLADLRREAGDTGVPDDFLHWLAALAPAIASGGQNTLRQLEYDGDNLNMEISVPDYLALEKLQQNLTAYALVDSMEAQLENGRVQGRFLIRKRR